MCFAESDQNLDANVSSLSFLIVPAGSMRPPVEVPQVSSVLAYCCVELHSIVLASIFCVSISREQIL